jgi:hypothetical protein
MVLACFCEIRKTGKMPQTLGFMIHAINIGDMKKRTFHRTSKKSVVKYNYTTQNTRSYSD